MADNVRASAGPRPDPREQLARRKKAETSAMAHLRQSVWEATQYLSYVDLREYVEGVLREVESDLP